MLVDLPTRDVAATNLALTWANRVDGEYLTEPLPDESRRILISRYAYLCEAFRPQPDYDLTRPVAEMLSPYWRRPAAAETYVYVLLQSIAAPIWAAVHAIERVRRGETAKSEFCPLPGQLRAIAWGLARPYWTEGKAIGRVLAARPPRVTETAEHRRAVAERILREFKRGLSGPTLPEF